MRTYDLETIFDYCMECADDAAAGNGVLDMGIPLMIAQIKDGALDISELDYYGCYLYDFSHHAYAKGWFGDVCFKSIQREESSILTVVQVDELIDAMKKALKKHFNKPDDYEIENDAFVLLELSYTDQGKRKTEVIIARNDWFDNISDFYDSWTDECLDEDPQ